MSSPDPSAVEPRLEQGARLVWTVMLVSSLASLAASFVLSVDAIALSKNPDAVLGCNISAVISCGTVGSSWQASVFGFPNAFLGLVTEPVVITIAVAALGGVRFPRWFMLAAHVGYALGLVFAYWLLYQSMFNIGALCPWCLTITVATTLVFFEMTRINIRLGHLPVSARVQAALDGAVRARFDLMVLIAWLLGLVLLVLLKYGAALLA